MLIVSIKNFLIVKYFIVLTKHLLSLQFDENRTIRSRYESSLRASLRVTKYLENWNVDKPFATLHVSPMATKLLSVTVSNHGNLCSKDLDPYYRYMYYQYILYISWHETWLSILYGGIEFTNTDPFRRSYKCTIGMKGFAEICSIIVFTDGNGTILIRSWTVCCTLLFIFCIKTS